MSRIVCFGEILLRLSPINGYERISKTNELKMDYAGAESNVAASLSILGHQAHYVTRLPAHGVGDAAIRSLREFGVNTNYILRGGKRVGTHRAWLLSAAHPDHL